MQNISTAWLTTNYTCNCKCDWCYAQKMLAKHRNMDLQYAKQIVKYLQVRGIRTITLIGGEPTIYPNLIELICYIKSLGIKVRLATNGKRFKDKDFAQRIVASKIDGINISIKGTTEEEYLYNTHQTGLRDMIEGYNNLSQLGFEPSISYVITTNDTKKFDEFVDMLSKEKLDNLVIQFEKPSLNTDGSSKTMDIRDMGDFTSYIFSSLEKNDFNYTIETSFPLCLIKKEILQELINKERISTCCHVQKGSGIVFDVTGEVIPCNHFLGYPFENKPLNLNEETAIEELLNTEIVKQFRDTVNRYPSNKCITCNLWHICGGGCFTRWFYINPKEYIDTSI